MDYKLGIVVFCIAFIVLYFAVSSAHHVSRLSRGLWTPTRVLVFAVTMPIAYILFVVSAPVTSIMCCLQLVRDQTAKLKREKGWVRS